MTTIHNLVLVAMLGFPKHESFIKCTIDDCAVNSERERKVPTSNKVLQQDWVAIFRTVQTLSIVT